MSELINTENKILITQFHTWGNTAVLLINISPNFSTVGVDLPAVT